MEQRVSVQTVKGGRIYRTTVVVTPAPVGTTADAEADGAPEEAVPPCSAPTLCVVEADIVKWFELIDHDQAVIEEVAGGGDPPALESYLFPAAMIERFPSLRLYAGETMGVGEGGRATGAAEMYACICSLSIMTSVLRAYYASEKGEDAVIARATAIITQYQRRGNTLFGASNPAFPLAEENVATWGRQLVSHAPSPEAMAASYLTMVIHDLAKIKSIVSTLKAKYALTLQGTCNEWITAKLVEDVVAAGGSFGGVVGLQDIMGCDPVMRNAICSGFATGFSAAQLVQGESTVVDGLKVGQFLEANPAAGWYMDHFMLDTAGILGKPHKFTGTIIVDGHTFVPFSGYVERLIAAHSAGQGMTAAHEDYHNFRLGLVASSEAEVTAQTKGLAALAAKLEVDPAHMRVAFARTLELSRTTTAASAVGALQCWSKAADRFGVELLASLVRELNVHGVEKDGSASTDCTKVAILLEYAPMLLNNAAKSSAWATTCPIVLALVAELFNYGRKTICRNFSATTPSNPYIIDINKIAMRTNPRYAEQAGYTWVSWFEEAQVAFEAGDDMGPLMSRAQGLVMLTN